VKSSLNSAIRARLGSGSSHGCRPCRTLASLIARPQKWRAQGRESFTELSGDALAPGRRCESTWRNNAHGAHDDPEVATTERHEPGPVRIDVAERVIPGRGLIVLALQGHELPDRRRCASNRRAGQGATRACALGLTKASAHWSGGLYLRTGFRSSCRRCRVAGSPRATIERLHVLERA